MRAALTVVVVVPALVLTACGGGDEAQPAPETVTVTAVPSADPDQAYRTADDVLSVALATGLLTCVSTVAIKGSTGANSELACRERRNMIDATLAIKAYDDQAGLDRGIKLFRDVARFDVEDGQTPDQALVGRYWIAAGAPSLVAALEPLIGGELQELV